MKEVFLHAVWHYSLYSPQSLLTEDGEQVTILSNGMYNTNAGPDFLEAKIRVGNTQLIGHVEMHVNSSDWQKHNHDKDAAYNNVILHVVYNNDVEEATPNIPVLCIAPHISQQVLDQYHGLIQSSNKLPCAQQLPKVKDITKEAWLTRLLAERWEEKLSTWELLLKESAGDWRSLLYWRLAANFGFKVNAAPFLALAQSIPINVLAKHGNSLQQIEALLFGQSGLLDNHASDEYVKQLHQEYSFLQKKYQLTPISAQSWMFMRMRPANFPTVRIAQFAALIHQSIHLFSKIIEKSTVKEIMPLFDISASSYWDNHYRFGEESSTKRVKKMGKSSIHNIIINTVAPIKFLYAAEMGTAEEQEKALTLIDSLPVEKNHILDIWHQHKWEAVNAAQSQAQIQLYNNYCKQKKCIACAIGLSIIKS